MAEYTLGELAHRVHGEVAGDATRRVGRVAPLDAAGAEDLSLVASRKYLRYVGESRAGAVLVSHELAAELPASRAQIRVVDVHAALGEIIGLLYPPPPHRPGIHPSAVVDASAELGEAVGIGPFVVIGPRARLGARCRVDAHTVVGEGCQVGDDTVLHAQVTLYPGVVVGQRCIVHSGARLGTDGFGYTWTEGRHRKVPQVGGCRIGDDVEIGANTAIDRGSIGDTVVGAGSKLDNLVHLGHNVRVGRHAILVAQVGVAGSSSVGDGAVLGGQVGISGHLSVGAGARVGAQAGVIGDIPPGETVSGYPARPHREALRAQAALFRLPAMIRRIEQLERRLARLERAVDLPDARTEAVE
jgi:UDP-3-O-[3-hydroxymyristoyl] glucosamine N-acyltransferase